MKRADKQAFMDFLFDEATKYRVTITPAEVELWFETFERTTLEDFRAAWVQLKRDDKLGGMFPKIPWMQRALRTTGDEVKARDWRCVEEVGQERCGYPGAINGGYGFQCRAHYRLRGSSGYSESSSMQIIEASRSYVPPKSPMEAMERGAAQREAEGARWRERNAALYKALRPADGTARVGLFAARILPPALVEEREPTEADEHIARADAMHLDEINAALAQAAQEDAA